MVHCATLSNIVVYHIDTRIVNSRNQEVHDPMNRDYGNDSGGKTMMAAIAVAAVIVGAIVMSAKNDPDGWRRQGMKDFDAPEYARQEQAQDRYVDETPRRYVSRRRTRRVYSSGGE